MDYSSEPDHSPLLTIRGTEPFNAEAPTAALVRFQRTPSELVYCRNHGPVTKEFDEETYRVNVSGGVRNPLELSLHDIQTRYPKVEVIAALQCAGNRRVEMAEIQPVKGILWADGTIGNCFWGGAKLSDILQDAQIDHTNANAQHVCFASHAAPCEDDTYFGGSVPISHIEDGDIILAYEMNGAALDPDHGGPVRIVAPGFLGARWVKRVDSIIISENESQNWYQQCDYKILPSSVSSPEEAKHLWKEYPAMTQMPLNSVIASIVPLSTSGRQRVHVTGYAIRGAAGPIVNVEVSSDEGESWRKADITYQEGKWSWTLWEIIMDTPEAGKQRILYSRARDAGGNVQEKEGRWNIRGVAYSAWGRRSW